MGTQFPVMKSCPLFLVRGMLLHLLPVAVILLTHLYQLADVRREWLNESHNLLLSASHPTTGLTVNFRKIASSLSYDGGNAQEIRRFLSVGLSCLPQGPADCSSHDKHPAPFTAFATIGEVEVLFNEGRSSFELYHVLELMPPFSSLKTTTKRLILGRQRLCDTPTSLRKNLHCLSNLPPTRSFYHCGSFVLACFPTVFPDTDTKPLHLLSFHRLLSAFLLTTNSLLACFLTVSLNLFTCVHFVARNRLPFSPPTSHDVFSLASLSYTPQEHHRHALGQVNWEITREIAKVRSTKFMAVVTCVRRDIFIPLTNVLQFDPPLLKNGVRTSLDLEICFDRERPLGLSWSHPCLSSQQVQHFDTVARTTGICLLY